MITLIGKRSLLGTSNRQQLNSNFEVCLDGFSSNVQELLNNLEFRNQILRLSALMHSERSSRSSVLWTSTSPRSRC